MLELPDGTELGRSGDHAEVNGAKIYYEVHGEGEPLLLMHGAWSTLESFSHQAAELSRHFKVILAETRGHGRSPDTPQPFTYRQSADDMLALLDHLGARPAHLLGWSNGAVVGLVMCLERPEHIGRFVSISGTFNTRGLTERFLRWFESATPESLDKLMIRAYQRVSPDGPDHFDVVFDKVKRQGETHPELGMEDLGHIDIPTLVMAGDRDIIYLDHSIDFYRGLPRAELSIVPGADHLLLRRRADIVNPQIIDFLTRD
ncbi:MAG: alpha/beta fold hydrolase [Thermoplasmatota archaeon]